MKIFSLPLTFFCISIALPIIFVLTLLIRLDSPGQALFRQTRIGKNRRNNTREESSHEPRISRERRETDLGGRPFTFFKFRTMKANARELYPELYAYRYSDDDLEDFTFKIENDPRHTRLGNWLRKTSLDELPNFINVLKGDVAIVGPRPEIPEMTKYYKGDQRKKFNVRPGVTGLAQINGRGRLKFQKTIEYDIEYVKKKSLLFDLKIILKTIYVVVRGHGAF